MARVVIQVNLQRPRRWHFLSNFLKEIFHWVLAGGIGDCEDELKLAGLANLIHKTTNSSYHCYAVSSLGLDWQVDRVVVGPGALLQSSPGVEGSLIDENAIEVFSGILLVNDENHLLNLDFVFSFELCDRVQINGFESDFAL